MAELSVEDDLFEHLRAWACMHADAEFAARPRLEQAEIRSVLWLSTLRTMERARPGSVQAMGPATPIRTQDDEDARK